MKFGDLGFGEMGLNPNDDAYITGDQF